MGFEPIRISSSEPKSDMSTNFIISAGQLAQLVRASRLHRESQRFEPVIAHNSLIRDMYVCGYRLMVNYLPSKQETWVRFPLSASHNFFSIGGSAGGMVDTTDLKSVSFTGMSVQVRRRAFCCCI